MRGRYSELFKMGGQFNDMPMPLHCTRDKTDPAFDEMFRNCRHMIRRVDELHSSPDNDSTYVFIVWAEKNYEEHLPALLADNISPQAFINRLDEGLFSITELVC